MSARIDTQSGLDSKIKGICDVLRRSNCAGALQYVPELSWLLFLRFLDEREQREETDAEVLGIPFLASLESPWRWRDWGLADGSETSGAPEGQAGRCVPVCGGRTPPAPASSRRRCGGRASEANVDQPDRFPVYRGLGSTQRRTPSTCWTG